MRAEKLRTIWDYMKSRKKFWLAPILIILIIIGTLLVFAQTYAVLSPFIYILY